MTYTLVGIDLETGGLAGYVDVNGKRVHGAAHYPILEIGIVVTNTDLEVLDKFSVGLRPSRGDWDKMSPWAQKQHEQSGLLVALKDCSWHDCVVDDDECAPGAFRDKYSRAAGYIKARLQKCGAMPYDRKAKTGSVAFGNNVGSDMTFLDAQMPELAEYFHFRHIDISSLDMLNRTVWEGQFSPIEKDYGHTALADILESLKELRAYTLDLEGAQQRMYEKGLKDACLSREEKLQEGLGTAQKLRG